MTDGDLDRNERVRVMDRLADLARARIPDDIDPARDAAGREQLIAAIAGGGARPSQRRAARWGAVLVAAALCGVIALAWPARRLGYAVEGAPVAEGGYVAAPADAEAQLRFTDGSAVALAAGASMRVAEVAPEGARMQLEGGRASLRITPRPGARWSVEAGPFVVLVTGTAFDVEWTRGEDTLRVVMHEGAVTVRGPLAPDGVPLRAGQRLVARLRERDLQILGAEATAAAPATALPSQQATHEAPTGARDNEALSPPNNPEPESPSSGSTPPHVAPSSGSTLPGVAPPEGRVGGEAPSLAPALPGWSKRVAGGDFKGVIAEAEKRGIDGVLDGGTLEELTALGDAARYTGRGELARKALGATRRRYPGSSAGKAAAFLLGRLADGGGSGGQAIGWYDTYLAESPGGPFAAEALGRKMVATQRTAGRAAARPIAAQYLARYPKGAHATVARDLVKP